jgi:replicative DNA helicase
MGILEIMTRARRLKSELKAKNEKLGLLIIDYIQLMHGLKKTENRQQEIAEISRAMKSMARELDLPVIAVSQLSRKPEEHGRDGRPRLSDLRESGALEQDADMVMFIVRDDLYKKDPETEGKAKIVVAKQRNGPTGEFDMVFNSDYTRFDDLDKRV